MPRRVAVRPRQRHDRPVHRVVRAEVFPNAPAEDRRDPVASLARSAGLRCPDPSEAPEHVPARDPIHRLVQERSGVETECRLPLVRQRAPCLPTVPMKLDGAFGGLGERWDAAPARVAAVAHRPAVVQRLPPRLGERDFGIRPEPDRSQPLLDPEALAPRLADAAGLRPVHPEAQTAPAAPVPVHARTVDRADERGGEGPRSFRHAFLPRICITYCNTIQGRIHGLTMDCKGRKN